MSDSILRNSLKLENEQLKTAQGLWIKLMWIHWFPWSYNEWIMTSKGKTWSLGTNSRLPFAINVILNLSIDKNTKKLACENSHLSLLRCKRCFTGVTSAPQQQKFPSGKEQGVMAVFAGYRKRSISWTRKDPFCSCGNSTGNSQQASKFYLQSQFVFPYMPWFGFISG